MRSVPAVQLNNGSHMPAIGLGTWLTKGNEGTEALKAAIDLGYRHFDCALVYQNEKAIGQAVREKIAEGVVKREEMFLTSKLWNTYHRPDLVEKGLRKTLRNLGLDYLDLYLIHWPMAFKPTDKADEPSKEHRDLTSIMTDPEFIPVDEKGRIVFGDDDFLETWNEMEKCVNLGLTKSIGVSNFNSDQIQRLLTHATVKPVTNQVEVHPYLNQKKLIQFCKNNDILVTAYSPLGSQNPSLKAGLPKILDHPKILQLAQQKNKTPAQIVLRYLVQLKVVPIPKSSNVERLKENIAVFDFALSAQEFDAVDTININQRACTIPGTETHRDYPFGTEF